MQCTPAASFEQYKKQHLSKIHTYTDDTQTNIYFYFYKGKRSDYYVQSQLKLLRKKFEEHEAELIKEFREVKKLRPAI